MFRYPGACNPKLVDEEDRLARVDVAAGRRTVENSGLLDDEGIGAGGLVHVGFPLPSVNAEETGATRDASDPRMLQKMSKDPSSLSLRSTRRWLTSASRSQGSDEVFVAESRDAEFGRVLGSEIGHRRARRHPRLAVEATVPGREARLGRTRG